MPLFLSMLHKIKVPEYTPSKIGRFPSYLFKNIDLGVLLRTSVDILANSTFVQGLNSMGPMWLWRFYDFVFYFNCNEGKKGELDTALSAVSWTYGPESSYIFRR